MSVTLLHQDCMEYMAGLPDGAFDLAIVDPPYGINACKQSLGEGGGLYRGPKTYKRGDWDSVAPEGQYFSELFRVARNVIAWGANHYIDRMPIPSPCWIVWDKNNGETDFADCELAWTSFKSPVRKYTETWSGFCRSAEEKVYQRIHPTQKPVALYRWLLHNYAKPGWRILDTHLGSGSSAIAAHEMGFEFVGLEIDADYIAAARKRFDLMTRQTKLDL